VSRIKEPLAILPAFIAAALIIAAQTVPQTPTQTVEGRVLNSVTGAGIPGAKVDLLQIQPGKIAYSATTDALGNFRIEGVKDGAYTVNYDARGFWGVPGFLGGMPQPFQVASGGNPVHLEAKMPPIGKISGRVLDTAGKPVANAGVSLRWESWACSLPFCLGFAPQTKTDEKGEYSISNLNVPGAWLVSATAPSSLPQPESQDDQRLGWAQTYYPGVTDPQLAARFVVQPGRELTVDIKLAAVPVHRIRGRVINGRGDPAPQATVTLSKGRAFLNPLQTNTKDDGTFEFESIADDEWRLTSTLNRDGIKLWSAQDVRLEGRDLENIELQLAAPFAINGKILVDVPQSVPAPSVPELMLEFHAGISDAGDPGGTSFSKNNPEGKGDFTIKNLYPGPYQILQPPPPYHLDSVRLGDHEVLVQSDIQILSGAQPLYARYKLSGGGTVRGTVEGCSGAHVLLIPKDPTLRRTGFIRHTTCSQNGVFEIPTIPGEYYGIAIAADSPTPWYAGMLDDNLIEQATSVTVRADESTSAEIRLITRQ
jgi:hypothetical protein